ncbi:hypothetical protein TYRP_019827 [Tyrophagus putrescentiae]|nr:hypothetical protein TYRP_019827 [Tyrophagus putrescentiae]
MYVIATNNIFIEGTIVVVVAVFCYTPKTANQNSEMNDPQLYTTTADSSGPKVSSLCTPP